MRSLKFRAWDKKENKMTDLSFCISNSGVPHIIRGSKEFNDVVNKFYKDNGDIIGGDFGEIDYTDWYAANLEIMQFTGKHDVSNKEIYEDDYCDGRFNAEDEAGWSGIVNWDNEKGCYMLANNPLSNYKHLKIIGNKFEHPNLLPTKVWNP